jgi:hypothetical protein
LYGFSELDFKVVEIKRSGDNRKIIDINVVRTSTGHEQNYYLDKNPNWLIEFEDDLKHGIFGQHK